MPNCEPRPVPFPLWQIERTEYEAICDYLALSPNAKLYERLSAYLACAPFRFASPLGFARFLAELPLTRFRVERLDFLTKSRFPGHPLRHALNAIMALHECSSEGYRELSEVPRGAATIPALAASGAGFVWRLLLTIPWLGWQGARYLVGAAPRGAASLANRIVLVTGASRGLGLDVLLECLERGASVVAVLRREDSVAGVRALLPPEAPVKFVIADLALSGALPEALQRAQIAPESIDMAVLCAGVKHDGESVLAVARLRDTFEVNCFSAAEFAAWLCGADHPAHAPANPRQPRPAPATTSAGANRSASARRLVLVSSIGRWHGMHATCGYNASKAALSIWGESLDMELRGSGLAVTIVEPGMFESGMTPRSGLAKLLVVPRRALASRIVSAAMAGRKSLRPPFWFAMLTWAVCIAGRGVRYRLFTRVKPAGGRDEPPAR